MWDNSQNELRSSCCLPDRRQPMCGQMWLGESSAMVLESGKAPSTV